jgi:hypothetical protein
MSVEVIFSGRRDKSYNEFRNKQIFLNFIVISRPRKSTTHPFAPLSSRIKTVRIARVD